MNVCVYGSSSAHTPEKYLKEAHELGRLLAEGGHLCINGAGSTGCMGALNDGVHKLGGRVRGVIHAKFVVDRAEHAMIKDLIIVEGDDLQQRKKALVHGVDAIIALPGGPGTWDELFEQACQRSIGFSGVPIVAVNVDHFYDAFIQILNRAHEDGLLYLPPKDIIHFEPTAAAALQWCVDHKDRPAATATILPIKVSRATPAAGTSYQDAIANGSIDNNSSSSGNGALSGSLAEQQRIEAELIRCQQRILEGAASSCDSSDARQIRGKSLLMNAALFAAGSLCTLAIVSAKARSRLLP